MQSDISQIRFGVIYKSDPTFLYYNVPGLNNYSFILTIYFSIYVYNTYLLSLAEECLYTLLPKFTNISNVSKIFIVEVSLPDVTLPSFKAISCRDSS